MVAPKRGRGAKGQAAKTRASSQVAEEPQIEPTDLNESMAEAADDNGDAGDQQIAEDEGGAEGADETLTESAEPADGAPEVKKEEKVESGKVLVENLPSSYLFDYQEKLKELFSKHGEVVAVK